ncbi:hypothetical protein PIB30_023914 [Stylosanthes scabra]|uniref:Uncharacterized protein n=1 Tax=Stylosanthes scabra TaxID=79078 RepID=A0ABU6U9K7_9FABA|nr:hypothetical protein [Stylosanthes scabra]
MGGTGSRVTASKPRWKKKLDGVCEWFWRAEEAIEVEPCANQNRVSLSLSHLVTAAPPSQPVLPRSPSSGSTSPPGALSRRPVLRLKLCVATRQL